MARSLKVSLQYRNQVKSSLLSAGFPTQQDFAEKLKMSRATVSKFLNGKSVGRLNFIEMCHALGFEWEDIADFSNASNSEMTQELINSTTEHEQKDYYIERFPIEQQCFNEILKDNVLIKIKAPHQMGKTVLINKILKYAETKELHSVLLDLQSADKEIFENLDIFLQWFCFNITYQLNLPNKMADFWGDLFGSKLSCRKYVEKHILSSLNAPLILGIDEVDILFAYPELATDFLGLLRAWYNRSRRSEKNWHKFGMILAYSTEFYIFTGGQSPFNVGLSVVLPYFNDQQVRLLAQKYEMTLTEDDLKLLTDFVGGQPYLLQLTFQRLQYKDVTLKELFKKATDENSIYRDHLREKLLFLHQDTKLSQSFKSILLSKEGIYIDLNTAFKLESLGLVKLKNNQVVIPLKLYRDYFIERLNLLNCD